VPVNAFLGNISSQKPFGIFGKIFLGNQYSWKCEHYLSKVAKMYSEVSHDSCPNISTDMVVQLGGTVEPKKRFVQG
jgi:hypothetical protein